MNKPVEKSSPEAIVKSILMLKKINPNLSDRQLAPMAADLIKNYARDIATEQMEICASRVFGFQRYANEEREYIKHSNMPVEISKDTDIWMQKEKENEQAV